MKQPTALERAERNVVFDRCNKQYNLNRTIFTQVAYGAYQEEIFFTLNKFLISKIEKNKFAKSIDKFAHPLLCYT